MLSFPSIFSLAQIFIPGLPTSVPPAPPAAPVQRQILQPQEVRSLPGQLDTIPVFNSNSPEVVLTEGVLLSTFPPAGKQVPSAHLNYPLERRFDFFSHHIARGRTFDDSRALYQGVLVYNPGRRSVNLDILQGVSYMSQEAPFNLLPSYVANPLGTVFAGPGSRVMNDVLRGQRQITMPARIVIPPRRSQMLMNVPILLARPSLIANSSTSSGTPRPNPLPSPNAVNRAIFPGILPGLPVPQNLPLPLNGRSTLMHLSSSGSVYIACMAMFARSTPEGGQRAPTLVEWQMLLNNSGLAGPRDTPPTPPDTGYSARFFYGRVAGVAQGSQWVAQLTDSPQAEDLSIPQLGEAFSYAISTVDHGTLGTSQIQSAPMLARYPDTAYRAHGNYGILYDLTLPLHNSTGQPQTVAISIQTPIKQEILQGGLRFLEPPDNQIFFRGTVRLRYKDDFGIIETRYIHIVQRRGQVGDPLITLRMPSGDRRLVQVQFLYPPDSTPPQVLTVQSLPLQN
jgi:hypothetical protein